MKNASVSPRFEPWHSERRAVIVSIGVAVVITLLYFAFHRSAAPSTQSPAAAPLVAATPASFSDFIGRITAIHDSSWTVVLQTTDERGQSHQRTYDVSIGPDTAFKLVSTQTGVSTPLTARDFRTDQLVHVAGTGNLATVTHFTATSISQFTHS